MLRARDFRRQAYDNMRGKWGTLALTNLVFSIIIGACGALSFIFIGGLAALVITGPLSLGFAIQSINLIRGKNVEVADLFQGFKRFLDAFLAYLLITIFTFLWSLLFFFPGLVMSYAYSMTYYILNDNPGMSANDARKRSIELMRGNKWRLFCLHLSFIGWFLLCALTLGILSFWVAPYIQAANAAFYQSLLPEEEKKDSSDGTADIDPFAEEKKQTSSPFDAADGEQNAPSANASVADEPNYSAGESISHSDAAEKPDPDDDPYRKQ